MPFSRTENILLRITTRLKQAKVEVPVPEMILLEMGETEKDLARECLAIQREKDFTLEPGVAQYDMGTVIWRVKNFFQASHWSRPLEIIMDDSDWAKITRKGIHAHLPEYVHAVDRYLLFHPKPTSAERLKVILCYLPQLQIGRAHV